MNAAASFARAELVIIFGALLCLVVMRMLTGRINLDGLLSAEPGQRVSPERAQLLVATLGAAGYLLLSIASPTEQGITFPSGWLVLLFGGSQGVYLLTKYLRPATTAWQQRTRIDRR
jgi:hypothetical protein